MSAASPTAHRPKQDPALLGDFVAQHPAMQWPDQLFPPNGGVGSMAAEWRFNSIFRLMAVLATWWPDQLFPPNSGVRSTVADA